MVLDKGQTSQARLLNNGAAQPQASPLSHQSQAQSRSSRCKLRRLLLLLCCQNLHSLARVNMAAVQ